MRTLIIGFLVFLLWLGFCRWYYVCKIKDHCENGTVQVDEPQDVRAKTLSLIDNGKPVLEGYDQFRFDGDNSLNPVLNENNEEFIAKVAAFLKNNPDKKLTITGQFLQSEKDVQAGMFENLGLARANAVRDLLAKAGIPVDRINLDYNMIGGDDADLSAPVAFLSTGPDAAADGNANNGDNNEDGGDTPEEYSDEAAVGQAFNFYNMSFSDANFAYNSDKFNPGSAFQTYADSVTTFMSLNPDKSLTLTGHTCDLGSDSYNMKLGKKRAESVKKYFRNKGVEASINTDSDGETNPAYPNTNDGNRSKNRRVNVQIK